MRFLFATCSWLTDNLNSRTLESILLLIEANMETICENDLTAKIEILHLGWIIYSIATWHIHKYYYFNTEDPKLSDARDLPPIDGLCCGTIIIECWNGEYISMVALNEEARDLLMKSSCDNNSSTAATSLA